MSITKIVSELL